MIRDEDVALVREQSPVADVIGEHLELRSAGGGSLKGLCPFHEEKTPSFSVTPARGLWYCFSCADGGDVIKFAQKIDGLGFTEAVERLAARAGIELRYEGGGHVPGQEHTQRRRLTEAHRAAADFYAGQLATPDAAPGREFLASRGFTLEDAARFGVGYAPAGWDALTRHLRGLGFTDADLLAGGLASQGKRGTIDRFRGRLTWPVTDLAGDVIAFGARKLRDDDTGPKYLNSPESPLFRKSAVLYGASLARRAISQRRQAVIVEGYTDVMACHLAGVDTAVATSGTSFGDGHVAILRRLLMDADWDRGEVIFTFDGDAAGRKAALRAFSMEEKFVTQTFVAVQPDGLDPCDLRVQRGAEHVRDLVASRVPLYEFAIRSEIDGHDTSHGGGKLAALDAAAKMIAGVKDAGRRKVYARMADRWLGLMDEELILSRIAVHVRDGARAAPRQRAAPVLDAVLQVEREALRLAVQRPALCGPVFGALGADCFTGPGHAAAYAVIASCGTATAGGGREWAARLRDAAPDDQVRGFLTMLAVEPVLAPGAGPDDRYAAEVLARVEDLSVTREIAAVKARLERTNPVKDAAAYGETFSYLIMLEQRHKALGQPG